MIERTRIDWIDCLKGATVLLVVLNHGLLTYAASGAPDTIYFKLAYQTNAVLTSARMPGFFLCGGLVLSFLKRDRMEWFLAKRLPFALWCILIWTIVYAALEALGLHLFPWGPSPFIDYRDLFVVPYGGLWFIYALLLMSLWAGLVRKAAPLVQYGGSIVLCIALTWLSKVDGLDPAHRYLLEAIALRGLPFFMLGICFGRAILGGLVDRKTSWEVAFVAAAVLTSIWWAGPFRDLPKTYLEMFPVTALFVIAVRMCAENARFRRVFGSVGGVSLEVFLSHQIVLALLFLAAGRHVPAMWPPLGILFLTAGTAVLTAIICLAMPNRLRRALFSAPAWLYGLSGHLARGERTLPRTQ